MSIYRSHILIPIDQDTVQAGALQIKRVLLEELARHNLVEEVKVLDAGTVGAVSRGAILVVYPDKVYYYNLKEEDIPILVREHLVKGRVAKSIEHELVDSPPAFKEISPIGLGREQRRVVLDKTWKIDPENIDEVLAMGGYRGLEKIVEQNISPAEVIAIVKESGLRGRGGAGFPTGMKWDFTSKAAGEKKFFICNADEGEPGTFKDRLILEGDPHKLIEAMIIGGYAVGADKGFVYIRGEYQLSIDRLQKAIDQAGSYGLLGGNILESGFSFDIEIKKGAGAYVCGEETALIESLEGKRGNPRVKPPYPVSQGLWQKPTVVNNVETLASIPFIIEHGAAAFASIGPARSPGTKVFTILGHVENPGLIEVEMGTSLREIIFSYGGGIKAGKRFKAALLGGAAGVFVPDSLLDVNMDFESLKEKKAVLGSGAVLVMDETASVFEMLVSILKFFAHESCGQCMPCRVGTMQLLRIIMDMKNGRGKEDDLRVMTQLAEMMQASSLCPLGQSPIMPIMSALEHFGTEFADLTKSKS